VKKVLLIIAIVVAAGAIITPMYIRNKDKALSPEDNVVYGSDPHKLVVFYSRPYNKGRSIFGGLVPYDQVWRTGANNATIFSVGCGTCHSVIDVAVHSLTYSNQFHI
jgi:hypothetical protein